ncbi:unnamed protein product [Rotaria socialis]|uniref:ubiquitinyl hydrolase 1 n=1 Tax=Rotaria socialis TaxID=392032 RepID=A0A817PQ73_9BILA|nr:unnamed protein product [Rotaria socialis]CAF3343308.1 unnamed protein product [Rotaria socialis]CAF4170946.1 unnamed protein product [Rotaria socialis]CAF4283099.1 unnamed protein product [Rotaria socialis]
MSASLSASPKTQSRDSILNIFHEITGMNFEDCLHFLNQYNWKLQNILEDFYKGKEFKNKSSQNSNEKSVENRRESANTQHPNLGSFYTKRVEQQQFTEDYDHYFAGLLQRFGDTDELARKNGTHRQHYQQIPQTQKLQEKSSKDKSKNEEIYHEKQELLRCGIHSLNNLFQIPHLFTHKHLDGIVREFDNRHNNNDYGILWIGDYDLRILIEAINRCGHLVRQINFYNGEPLQNLPWDSYFGLLINLNGAHWFTIKNLNEIYYNLDSTFTKPLKIGLKDDLVKYLISFIQNFTNVYIFTVLKQTYRS